MKESDFLMEFCNAARFAFADKYLIMEKQNLFYELAVNEKMQLAVSDIGIPKRGSSAFQVDICISDKSSGTAIPRVVIEFKTNPSTHEILVYSAKAGKHKRIYPWLRYGILADSISKVPDRFFKHNESLDFFIAAEKHRSESDIQSFVQNFIESELEISKTLERIYFGKESNDFYRTRLDFMDFKDLIKTT